MSSPTGSTMLLRPMSKSTQNIPAAKIKMTAIMLKWNRRLFIYFFFLQMLASQSWSSRLSSVTGTNVQMGAGLMKRNSYGKGMGHRRVRKIDFTVNLIYQLFWRCRVSRGHIKPTHKQASTSCISRSTPSNHCALRGNNRINISGYLAVSDYPK